MGDESGGHAAGGGRGRASGGGGGTYGGSSYGGDGVGRHLAGENGQRRNESQEASVASPARAETGASLAGLQRRRWRGSQK